MKILIAGLMMLLTGFVGWTLPMPDTDKTILALNQLCKNGTQGHVIHGAGLNCSTANDITYLIYALLVTGMILTLTGSLLTKLSTSVKKY